MIQKVERLKDLPPGAWYVSNDVPEEVAKKHPDKDVIYYQGALINGHDWYVCVLVERKE